MDRGSTVGTQPEPQPSSNRRKESPRENSFAAEMIFAALRSNRRVDAHANSSCATRLEVRYSEKSGSWDGLGISGFHPSIRKHIADGGHAMIDSLAGVTKQTLRRIEWGMIALEAIIGGGQAGKQDKSGNAHRAGQMRHARV